MKKYNYVVQIQSESNPKKFYTIKMDEQGKLSCNCLSWINNTRGNRTCKHIDYLLDSGWEDDNSKLIWIKDSYGVKVSLCCKNYPSRCDECAVRFKCWTAINPEFSRKEFDNAY